MKETFKVVKITDSGNLNRPGFWRQVEVRGLALQPDGKHTLKPDVVFQRALKATIESKRDQGIVVPDSITIRTD
ncbi:hypothetical protein ACFL2C_01490 [Patescibacteria group bacterium]